MGLYRLMLFPTGAPAEQLDLVCRDDADALNACYAQLARIQEAEAWDGQRLVCRMSRPAPGG